MKLDGAIIPIEPRDFGRQLDLAARFVQAHAAPITRATLGWTSVATIAIFGISSFVDHGVAIGCGLFYLISPLFGAVLVSAAGPAVFGAPFDLRGAQRTVARAPRGLIPAMLLPRILILGLFALTYLAHSWLAFALLGLAALAERKSAFAPEVYLLERPDGTATSRRVHDLQRASGGLAGGRIQLGRLVFVAVAYLILTAADVFLATMFDEGLVQGRIETALVFRNAGDVLIVDPVITASLQAALWIVYPLFRLTTFFGYLDVRTRSEGWDLDLLFRAEAARLTDDRQPTSTAKGWWWIATLAAGLATASLAPPVAAQVEPAPKEAVSESVARVLADPTFRHLERLRSTKSDPPEEAGGPDLSWLSGGMSVLSWIILGVAFAGVAVAIALMLSAVAARRREEQRPSFPASGDHPLARAGPPGDAPVEHYLDAAATAAGSGDYRIAIAQLLLGAMSCLEREGAVRYRRGLTNHDYLRAIRRQRTRRASLAIVVRHFDEVYYGGRTADANRYREARDGTIALCESRTDAPE